MTMSKTVYAGAAANAANAARKARADADLAEENLRKARLEKVKSTAALLLSACVALGVFTVFCYCAYQAHFFPSGLNVGDTLFFVFVALGFGAIYLMWLFVGYLAVRGTVSPFAWRRARRRLDKGLKVEVSDSGPDAIYFAVAAVFAYCGLFAVAWVSSTPEDRWRQVIAGMLPPLIGGWSFWFLLDSRSMQPGRTALRGQKLAQFKAIILVVGLVAPLFFALTITAAIQRAALTNLGVYADRAAIIASGDDFKSINATAQRLDIPVFSCSIDGTDEHMISGVRVWWNGIGDRTLIGFPDPAAPGKDVVRIELKRDGVRVVRLMKDSPTVGCLPFAQASWFERFNDSLTQDGKKDLTQFASKVEKRAQAAHLYIEGVAVIGHADRMPVMSRTDDNLKLSERRASNVAASLQEAWTLEDSQVHVTGVGSKDSATPCATTLDGAAMSDCLSPDRRVDVRVVLAPCPRTDDAKAGKAQPRPPARRTCEGTSTVASAASP
jgi:OmpA-OmpF porin, OOP family